MTSGELGALAKQFFDDGNQIEFDIVNSLMVALMERAEAQVQILQNSIERIENQQASSQQPRQSTRRVPRSPNSAFLSYRAAARDEGIIRSSPPPSPTTRENNNYQVQYSNPSWARE
jgi:hypothetical protein